MNIREHIDAGHYPTDGNFRALVCTRSGKVATILSTDLALEFGDTIIGVVRGDLESWRSDGGYTERESGWDLLPPEGTS